MPAKKVSTPASASPMTATTLPNDLATACAARRSELELEAQRALETSRQQFAAAHMTCVERASQPRIEVDLERLSSNTSSHDDVQHALVQARQQFAAARMSCVEDAQSAFESNRIELQRAIEVSHEPEARTDVEQALERKRQQFAAARTSCVADAQSAFESNRIELQRASQPELGLGSVRQSELRREDPEHGVAVESNQRASQPELGLGSVREPHREGAEQALEHARLQLAAARTSCVESALSIVESNRLELERASHPHLDVDHRRGNR